MSRSRYNTKVIEGVKPIFLTAECVSRPNIFNFKWYYVYVCTVLCISIYYNARPSTLKFQINIAVLTFIYISVSATWFDPAGSSSGSFYDTPLFVGLCPNVNPY